MSIPGNDDYTLKSIAMASDIPGWGEPGFEKDKMIQQLAERLDHVELNLSDQQERIWSVHIIKRLNREWEDVPAGIRGKAIKFYAAIDKATSSYQEYIDGIPQILDSFAQQECTLALESLLVDPMRPLADYEVSTELLSMILEAMVERGADINVSKMSKEQRRALAESAAKRAGSEPNYGSFLVNHIRQFGLEENERAEVVTTWLDHMRLPEKTTKQAIKDWQPLKTTGPFKEWSAFEIEDKELCYHLFEYGLTRDIGALEIGIRSPQTTLDAEQQRRLARKALSLQLPHIEFACRRSKGLHNLLSDEESLTRRAEISPHAFCHGDTNIDLTNPIFLPAIHARLKTTLDVWSNSLYATQTEGLLFGDGATPIYTSGISELLETQFSQISAAARESSQLSYLIDIFNEEKLPSLLSQPDKESFSSLFQLALGHDHPPPAIEEAIDRAATYLAGEHFGPSETRAIQNRVSYLIWFTSSVLVPAQKDGPLEQHADPYMLNLIMDAGALRDTIGRFTLTSLASSKYREWIGTEESETRAVIQTIFKYRSDKTTDRHYREQNVARLFLELLLTWYVDQGMSLPEPLPYMPANVRKDSRLCTEILLALVDFLGERGVSPISYDANIGTCISALFPHDSSRKSWSDFRRNLDGALHASAAYRAHKDTYPFENCSALTACSTSDFNLRDFYSICYGGQGLDPVSLEQVDQIILRAQDEGDWDRIKSFFSVACRRCLKGDGAIKAGFLELLQAVNQDCFVQNRYDPEKNAQLRIVERSKPGVLELWRHNKKMTLPQGTHLAGCTLEFTDNWTDLLSMGDEMQGSCLGFASGLHYDGIVATTLNGQSKLIVIKNSAGKMISRCTVRLMMDAHTGKPAIHASDLYVNPPCTHEESKEHTAAMLTLVAADCQLPAFADDLGRKIRDSENVLLESERGCAIQEYVDGGYPRDNFGYAVRPTRRLD